jgi:hypothetical protein
MLKPWPIEAANWPSGVNFSIVHFDHVDVAVRTDGDALRQPDLVEGLGVADVLRRTRAPEGAHILAGGGVLQNATAVVVRRVDVAVRVGGDAAELLELVGRSAGRPPAGEGLLRRRGARERRQPRQRQR